MGYTHKELYHAWNWRKMMKASEELSKKCLPEENKKNYDISIFIEGMRYANALEKGIVQTVTKIQRIKDQRKFIKEQYIKEAQLGLCPKQNAMIDLADKFSSGRCYMTAKTKEEMCDSCKKMDSYNFAMKQLVNKQTGLTLRLRALAHKAIKEDNDGATEPLEQVQQ